MRQFFSKYFQKTDSVPLMVILKATGQKAHQWVCIRHENRFPTYDPKIDPSSGQVASWPQVVRLLTTDQPPPTQQQPSPSPQTPPALPPPPAVNDNDAADELVQEIVQELEQLPLDLLGQAFQEVEQENNEPHFNFYFDENFLD